MMTADLVRARPRIIEPGMAAPARLLAGPALAVLAAACWLAGLHTVLPAQLGSLGLIAGLSPVQLAAYPLLVGAALAELTLARPRPRLLAALTALGVLLVYGLQPASEQEARMSVAWLHAGFAGYIAAHGHVLHGFDARFSWPGFFSLVAFITRASGHTDATALLRWAPVVLAGLATLGTRALASQILTDDRTAWIATWLFLLTEWTEQDYFSPQAVTYVAMLAALAVTFRHLARRPGGAEPPGGRTKWAAPVVVLIALALAPSHQLTPYLLAAFLLIMVITRRLRAAWLPVVVLALAAAWFAFGARDFWQGHLNTVVGGIGQVGTSVHQGLGSRFVGDAGRTVLLDLRVGLTVVMCLLAAAGWYLQRRRGVRSLTLPLLAAAPFALVALQSYGGEIFLRSYLFSLPFAAILAATAIEALLRPQGKRRAVRLAAALALLSGLGLATVAARGGNDAYTSISRADVAAVSYVYQHVRPGQTVGALLPDAPLNVKDVGTVLQISYDGCVQAADTARCLLAARPDYLVITPSQDNQGQIFDGLRPGWTGNLARQLEAAGRYRQVFDDQGSLVLAR
jgi:hypothetical protein